MDDEKLIEMVRNYEFIYNLKHPKYMDNVKKDIAWKEIGKQLRQSAIACKQRWQSLRDAYRRALNKKKGKSGQAAKNIKPWKYENEMAFVAPFFMDRKTQDSIELTSDDEQSDNGTENHVPEPTVSEKPNADIEIDDTTANVSDANLINLSDKVIDDEKLIEIVRNYEFIYNLKHPKCMDNVKKDIAWKEIGEQLKQSAIACKQRWQSLRDAYRRALNKKKGKSGQAAKNIKPWKYENEMAFVAPFFMDRKTQDSIELTSNDEQSDNGAENHVPEPTVSEKPNADIEIDDTTANVSDANLINLSDKFPNESQQIKKIMKPKAKKRKAVQSAPSASAILMAKLLDDQHKLDPPQRHDELDRFFLNISDTVKKFPPYVQALAKNKIFSFVSSMELQQLAPPSSTTYDFNGSPQSASTSATPMPTSPDWDDQTSQPLPTNSDNWNDQTLQFLP